MTEKYVVSLELAKKMKELGFKQESDFYWNSKSNKLVFHQDKKAGKLKMGGEYISAYHVGELGEMLPQGCASFFRTRGDWKCLPGADRQELPSEVADTEADARAAMLILLAQDKLIEVQ